MTQLTHRQYDVLERAIADRQRVAICRRGTEYVVVPARLRVERGRELIDTTHPATGDAIAFYLDDVDSIEVVR